MRTLLHRISHNILLCCRRRILLKQNFSFFLSLSSRQATVTVTTKANNIIDMVSQSPSHSLIHHSSFNSFDFPSASFIIKLDNICAFIHPSISTRLLRHYIYQQFYIYIVVHTPPPLLLPPLLPIYENKPPPHATNSKPIRVFSLTTSLSISWASLF